MATSEPDVPTSSAPSLAPVTSSSTTTTTITVKSESSNLASSLQPSSSNFQTLRTYPFAADVEFKLGLAVILGHSGAPATIDEVNSTDDLVVKAKCFYYSRKFAIQPPIDFSAYKRWLQSYSTSGALSTALENVTPPPPPTTTTMASTGVVPNSTPGEQPAYPPSFSHIVELITTGQPIPGIQQIPNTVLRGQEGPSTAALRRKPWEKEVQKEDAGAGAENGDISVAAAVSSSSGSGGDV